MIWKSGHTWHILQQCNTERSLWNIKAWYPWKHIHGLQKCAQFYHFEVHLLSVQCERNAAIDLSNHASLLPKIILHVTAHQCTTIFYAAWEVTEIKVGRKQLLLILHINISWSEQRYSWLIFPLREAAELMFTENHYKIMWNLHFITRNRILTCTFCVHVSEAHPLLMSQ